MARGPGLSLAIDRMALGGRPLFEDFRLAVPPGQILALIGPSGVGKTTLLRILAGIETRFAGQALVAGVPAAQAARPGYVFQDARLLPWKTAAGNLRLVRPDMGEAALAAALADVGLSGLGAAWPRELSGGMQRRLGLARALAVNAGLLLLDEPFVSLDRAVVRELQALVARLIADRQATAVLVSHDPEDAARLAHRAVLIAGRPVRILADLDLGGDPDLGTTPGARNRERIARLADRIEAAMAGAPETSTPEAAP